MNKQKATSRKTPGLTASQFQEFKNVDDKQIESVKKMYESYGDNDLFSKKSLMIVIFITAIVIVFARYFDFGEWKSTVSTLGSIILILSLMGMSKKDGHLAGYLEGYSHGYENGVEKSFGVDKDLSSAIADMATNAEIEKEAKK